MAAPLALGFANNAPWAKAFRMTRDGTAVDLTGAVMRMQLRQAATPYDPVMLLSTDNGRLVVDDGPNGLWSVKVEVAVAVQVPAGAYDHDMLVRLRTGEEIRAYVGTVTVDRGITTDPVPWQP